MKTLLIATLTPLLAAACAGPQVRLTVSNDSGIDIGSRTVSVAAGDILPRLGSTHFRITDEKGAEIPSQLTHDSMIIFTADVAPGSHRDFIIRPTNSGCTYRAVCCGRFYPERRDDIAYENQLGGFRIYGPGTQQAGEKSFGYDIFLKYPSDDIILPELYAPETDPAVWAKADSLRSVSDSLADEFIASFSYHIDHGKGFDPFAVGATLGAGTAALLENDSIVYPWCYDSAEILDNGPIRFTVALHFAPGQTGLTEHRVISLDSKSYLNRCRVWFEGAGTAHTVVAGFPLRDDTTPQASAEDGIVAYTSPVSGDDSGPVFLGIFAPARFDSVFVKDSHILGSSTIEPGGTFDYRWGFCWPKTGIPGEGEWLDYLRNQQYDYTITLK